MPTSTPSPADTPSAPAPDRTRCPEWRCDCFIETFPGSPMALHPEAFIVDGDV